MKLNSISKDLIEKYHSSDHIFADYFFHNCAEYWHKENVHKVYCLLNDQQNEILGFFSIRANEIDIKNEHIPILDIAYIDIEKNLDEDSKLIVLRVFLEYIEKIAIQLSNQIGCRYIRAYIPTVPDHINNNSPGKTIIKNIEDIYNEMNYMPPKFKIEKTIRKIKQKEIPNGKNELIIVYILRDLKFED